jgi:hypothetical protein
LLVKPNIHVIGSGQDITTLSGSIGSSSFNSNYSGALINVATGASLSSITIVNTGTNEYSTGIHASKFADLSQVTVRVSGADRNYGIWSDGGSIKNTTVSVRGGDYAYGMTLDGQYGSVDRVQVYVRDAGYNTGIHLPESSRVKKISNIGVIVHNRGTGIFISNRSENLLLEQVNITNDSLTTPSTGITHWCDSTTSMLTLRRSTVYGKENAIDLVSNFDQELVHVTQSTLIGGIKLEWKKGKLKCVACDDGSGSALDNNCSH